MGCELRTVPDPERGEMVEALQKSDIEDRLKEAGIQG
jgi:hypothetical protein